MEPLHLWAVIVLVLQFASGGSSSFQSKILARHNYYRALHDNVPALTTDKHLVKMAKRWAKHLAETKTFQHNTEKGRNVGENIYKKYRPKGIELAKLADQATDNWYAEIKDYDFHSGKLGKNSGHFTQMVWKGTTKLGCGHAEDANNTNAYVVCNYSMAGNRNGQFIENVPELRQSSV